MLKYPQEVADMFTMLVSMITTAFMFFIWFAIVLVIAIYIYINSRKYKMNTLLWVVIGLAFNFPGLCAYLIARRKTFRKKCPFCMSDTPKDCKFCPKCGVNLENSIPKTKLGPKLFICVCTAIVVLSWMVLIGISL